MRLIEFDVKGNRADNLGKPSAAVQKAIQNVRFTLNLIEDIEPKCHSKSELYDFHKKINGLMSYAVMTQNANLLEACYRIALLLPIAKGCAPAPPNIGYYLEEAQNIDNSVRHAIAELRKRK
jgi:hypothetical protein